MKVPIEAACTSPCTVIEPRELATTLPETCLLGILSAIRSWKLVSVRLKAVVCELAILPEIFSSANDCARMPLTAVVSAPKIPMTFVSTNCGARRRGRSREPDFASHVPRQNIMYFIYLDG